MVGHRYYNPEWGRWIQPDDIEYLDPTNINGLNLYAYCNNDPINYFDPDGNHPKWLKLLLTITASISKTLAYNLLNVPTVKELALFLKIRTSIINKGVSLLIENKDIIVEGMNKTLNSLVKNVNILKDKFKKNLKSFGFQQLKFFMSLYL